MPGRNRHLPVMRGVFTIPLVLGLSACNTQAQSGIGFPHGTAHADCGPADGPAIRVVLGVARIGDQPHATPAPPSLTLSIYSGIGPALRRETRIESPGRGRALTGSAEWCDHDGACRTALSGRVKLRELRAPVHGDTTLSGEYDLRMSSGVRQSGRFSARWLSYVPMCG